MEKFTLNINSESVTIECTPDTPLLWALRDNLGLTGTKYGCGKALCGACTVHVDGSAMRSCSLPISAIKDKAITTIEGVGKEGLHPVQKAWIAENVPQCGFCQSGQIMSAIALLDLNHNPTDTDIDQAMAGNICRCGTYIRIRSAIKNAAKNNII
jgi:aerobic-type carbon monoxide dehydrogenase small subunit (CoxS/CutS family)